jgi:hypothetical protein
LRGQVSGLVCSNGASDAEQYAFPLQVAHRR